ncbi:hypothetical protein COCON_G00085330 [Conger conger]|uniref:RNA-binding motif protein, X-linked 2 n=1 Tax=Conger conger TaxID=82655 RepID=A0A9Q1DR78_CONCO|nr:hypothetical protein COCON_G00085330 [Conger conger]
MNPLTKVKLINELNDREAQLGVKESVSWHSEYRDSAWIFIGGFPYELTEGDIICVFSQYGEIANINLVRDKKTGKSKGFCFICYEDQRSTILAVDNFNGIKIKGRTIRVDHVKNYRPPKDSEDIDDITKQLREDGCAPQRPPSSSSESEEEEYAVVVKKQKKDKKEKKKKKKEKKEKKRAVEERRDGGAESAPPAVRVKREREDSGYDKYAQQGALGPRAEHEDRAPGDRHGDRAPGDRHGDWPPGDRHGDHGRLGWRGRFPSAALQDHSGSASDRRPPAQLHGHEEEEDSHGDEQNSERRIGDITARLPAARTELTEECAPEECVEKRSLAHSGNFLIITLITKGQPIRSFSPEYTLCPRSNQSPRWSQMWIRGAPHLGHLVWSKTAGPKRRAVYTCTAE